MIAGVKTIQYAPALLAAPVAVTAEVHTNTPFVYEHLTSFVIGLGLALGILFRAGVLYDQKKPVSHIKRDVIVSLLIGGFNFVIAMNVISILHIKELHQALGIAIVVSATGVKSGLVATKWVWNKLIADGVADAQGTDRQERQKEASAARLADREKGE